MRPFVMVAAGLIIMLVPWLFSCQSDEACLSNQHAVQARFYSAWSVQDKDSVLSGVSVTGLGLTDSIYREQSLSELFLPLTFNGDTTSFVLSVRTLKDTLTFVHRKELDFISRECGYIFNFDLDTVMFTNAFIDSVAVDYPSVVYGESTNNIKLYIY